MPSSQITFCLQVSVDDLVASSSPRALLAFSQGWLASGGRVPLLGSGVLAMGEMVGGLPLERLPPSQHHLGCSPGMMCPLAQRDFLNL